MPERVCVPAPTFVTATLPWIEPANVWLLLSLPNVTGDVVSGGAVDHSSAAGQRAHGLAAAVEVERAAAQVELAARGEQVRVARRLAHRQAEVGDHLAGGGPAVAAGEADVGAAAELAKMLPKGTLIE